jgi:menaquinone reductase, molybdopterin-binding-like subunit
VDRRSFIALTAVTGTSATLASCGNPEHQIIRFIPDEEHVPGVAEWKPSMCPLCQAGCGVLVRVMEGDAEVVRGGQTGVVKMGLAKKLEGNPAHPISQGKLCARGQAAIQVTYHPDRLTHPLKRMGPRGTGEFQEIGWDEALAQLVEQLDRLGRTNNQRALAFLKRPGRGQRDALVSQFLDRFGAPPALSFELFSDDVLRRANLLSFGHEQLPTFDLAQSRYVISFGADFLGTWNSPVAQNAAYGRMRQGRRGVRGTFVQVEPRMSQTGANADEWVPVRPGTEGVLALGLAHALMTVSLRPAGGAGPAGALIDGWSSGLAAYDPASVERQTGVAPARLERLARDLVGQQPAVAIIGGAPLAHTNGLFSALAVNALNSLLGSVGEPGGVSFMPQMASSAAANRAGTNPPRGVSQVTAGILAADPSPVQVLLVDSVNPLFASPPAWRVRDALLKVPFIASFGSFIDETGALADLILPDHSFLESWVEGRPESGATVAVATLAPPAVRPLHNTRAMPDLLLQVAGKLARPIALPWKTFDEMLMVSYASLPASSPESDAWTTAQRQGGWWEVPGQVGRVGQAGRDRQERRSAQAGQTVPRRYADPQFDGDAAGYPFHFLPYASQAFLDGSLAHLPWLQEMPDVISTAMWSSWVEINTQTAARLGISQGDIVEVASTQGTLRSPALVSPGIAPDVIAMPVGQGHERFTRYASGRGANPVTILAPLTEPETGALAWAATRVKVTRVGNRNAELILFAGEMREHPHEGER